MTAKSAISHLFAPLTTEQFLTEYFEKRPLHIARSQPDYYADSLDFDTFLRLLTTISPATLQLMASVEQRTISPISLDAALNAFRAGGSLVVNTLESLHGPVAAFCRQLESFFYANIQTNVYLTPSGNQGFAVHFDCHDVFVMQIYGTKHWKVYGQEAALPYEHHQRKLDPNLAREALIDVVLEPGDLLYMPRGFAHEGKANGDTASLHMSVGLLAYTWRDLIRLALDAVADQDPALRASVPMGPHLRASLDFKGPLEKALELLGSEVRSSSQRDAEVSFAHGLPALLPEVPLLERRRPLKPTSRFQLHPMVVYQLLPRDDGNLNLIFHGKQLGLPPGSEEAMEYIFSQAEPFTADSVPAPLATRLQLVGFLFKEGLLQWID